MGEEVYYLTEEGADRLRAELEELTGPRREELAGRLRTAIQQGDLSENADYIAAKEEQGFLEGRIQEIQTILRYAEIIENEKNMDQVDLGARITVQEGERAPETYHIVGAKEANPREGRISNESPIGQALLGHREGEEVTAETPAGPIQLKILKIE